MQCEMKHELKLWRQTMPRKYPGRPKDVWESLEAETPGGESPGALMVRGQSKSPVVHMISPFVPDRRC